MRLNNPTIGGTWTTMCMGTMIMWNGNPFRIHIEWHLHLRTVTIPLGERWFLQSSWSLTDCSAHPSSDWHHNRKIDIVAGKSYNIPNHKSLTFGSTCCVFVLCQCPCSISRIVADWFGTIPDVTLCSNSGIIYRQLWATLSQSHLVLYTGTIKVVK